MLKGYKKMQSLHDEGIAKVVKHIYYDFIALVFLYKIIKGQLFG